MGSFRARRMFGAAVAVLALVVVQVAFAAEWHPDPREQPVDQPNAADNARAKSSIIVLSDLVKGFRANTTQGRAPVVPHCESYPGVRSDITVTGFASSTFMLTFSSISSSAFFFKSNLDSDRYWETTVRLPYIKCLATTLAFGPRNNRYKHRIVSAKQIKIGPTGADKAVAYRLIAHVSRPGKPFYWVETAAFVKQGRGIAMIRIVYSNYVCECHTGIAYDLARRLGFANRR
jgi:hypothetical protein